MQSVKIPPYLTHILKVYFYFCTDFYYCDIFFSSLQLLFYIFGNVIVN